MTGRCTQGKRFDVRGAFDGVWVHGKSPVLGIGDTENLKDRTGRGGERMNEYMPYGDTWRAQIMRHTKQEIVMILGTALAEKDKKIAVLKAEVKALEYKIWHMEAELSAPTRSWKLRG